MTDCVRANAGCAIAFAVLVGAVYGAHKLADAWNAYCISTYPKHEWRSFGTLQSVKIIKQPGFLSTVIFEVTTTKGAVTCAKDYPTLIVPGDPVSIRDDDCWVSINGQAARTLKEYEAKN